MRARRKAKALPAELQSASPGFEKMKKCSPVLSDRAAFLCLQMRRNAFRSCRIPLKNRNRPRVAEREGVSCTNWE